jgi:GTP 3',8-cyclase
MKLPEFASDTPRDSIGRRIHKVRVQITDACNFRCFYCMAEGAKFQPSQSLLRPSEIGDICGGLSALGIDEVRVTGGEPTMRPEFDKIITILAKIPWRKFGLTSNGYLLADKLPLLKELGCNHINISLDSLNESKFNSITRRPFFKPVMASIFKAASMGFEVKINTVVARGYNEMELPNFLRFAEKYGVEVRFLELMKVGPSINEHSEKFISAKEMIKDFLQEESLVSLESPIDSTSFGYQTSSGARIGFIASESQPFCGTCSRLRLTATGKLRACLFSKAGLDLRNRDPLDYPEILHEVMAMKPTGRLPEVLESMNVIGG